MLFHPGLLVDKLKPLPGGWKPGAAASPAADDRVYERIDGPPTTERIQLGLHSPLIQLYVSPGYITFNDLYASPSDPQRLGVPYGNPRKPARES
jgi:hypothetical protein